MYKIEIHQSGILINFTTDISIRPFTRFQYSRFVIFFFFLIQSIRISHSMPKLIFVSIIFINFI